MTDTEKYFEKHEAGGPTHVVVAKAVGRHGNDCEGIFSSIANAQAWADTLDDENFHGVVFVPYVIDVPEFGNIAKDTRH